MARLPLEGIRVLDLTRAYAGPIGTMYLSDLGAEVIKVEAISRPDIPTRVMNFADNDPGDRPWERAAFFHRLNVGKLDITLELTDPQGVHIFKQLVAVSDVVAENYKPGTMEKFGLQYEVLREINPRLIMVSMSGFGDHGPRKSWAAYFPAMENMAGLTSITGYPDGHPLNSTNGYGDWILGSAGAAAVFIALHHRNRTGKGQYIDVAGREAALVHIGEIVLDYTLNGRTQGRNGNRHPAVSPNDCYRCRGQDKWVAISVRDEEKWQAFCRVLGDPEWTRDPRFSDRLQRWQYQDEMRTFIEEWTSQREHREAAELLLAAGVPAAPVLNAKEVLLDPHMRARQFYEVIDHPLAGKRLFPRQMPAKFSAHTWQPRRPAPLLGQHDWEVLGGLLNMTDRELAELEEAGIIGTSPTRTTRQPPQPTLSFEQWRKLGAEIDEDYLDQLSAAYGQRLGPPP